MIIDDFRGDMFPFNFFLRLIDKYPVRVESKGSSTWFSPEEIIITSPFHPERYVPPGEEAYQLLRRITNVFELTIVYGQEEEEEAIHFSQFDI